MNATTAKDTTSHTNPAQACCQGATEAMKAGIETSQKMFSTFTENLTKVANPFTDPKFTAPMVLETMTKAVSSFVDSSARCMTECNTLMIDAMRNHARMFETAGDLMVGQMTGKNTKPVTDSAREIFNEVSGFSSKAGERLMKSGTEHAQRISAVMEESMNCGGRCKA